MMDDWGREAQEERCRDKGLVGDGIGLTVTLRLYARATKSTGNAKLHSCRAAAREQELDCIIYRIR